MDIQFQIRQNAMEMQEYMKDLFDWQKSIKKKERALAASGGADQATAPAPRGRASGAVAPAPAELMQPALGPKAASSTPKPKPATSSSSKQGAKEPIAKTAAAHTYSSYQKWDKFDVDAALASDDDENAAARSPSSSSSSRQKSTKAASTASPAGAANKPSSTTTTTNNSSTATATTASTATRTPQPPAAASSPAAPAAAAPPPPGITLTAHDPSQPQGDDLLRPVATTRTNAPKSVPTAPPATTAGAAAAGAAAAAAAAASATTTTTTAASPTGHAAAAAAPLPPIRNSQPTTADAWRARGNDLFKAGEYDSAFECYSRSVELQPTCLGHANRAMALLKLGRWQDAVADCTAAICLDPAYVKAYQRRAAAHRQLGSALQAARDWEAALRLEPENRASAADRDAALEALWEE
ncbi:hypothetical protein Agub_g5728, partial [Astrephomene gubernaculifera]